MNNSFLTYRPFVSPRNYPSESRRSAVPDRPHTYGVRLAPCGSFATEPCGPTACTGIKAKPAPNVHCSLYIVHCWIYTFSAKEKDVETGLSYFGSRYYSSDLSIWLSVDPMSDKYASLSPYNYCANNPVKLVDPNGEEIGLPGVKYLFMKASAGAGVGTALSATGVMGVSWDKGGTTRFIAYSTNYFVNQNLNNCSQNPSCIAGFGAGVTANAFYDWKSTSFKESISKQFQSIDLGVGGAVNISFRGGAFGFGGGVGEGGGVDVGNYKIAISISLSSNEAKTIRQLSKRDFFPSWQISGQKPIWEGGKITGYKAQIRTYDLSDRPIDTNINVYCGVDSKGRPDNRWSSNAYNAEFE